MKEQIKQLMREIFALAIRVREERIHPQQYWTMEHIEKEATHYANQFIAQLPYRSDLIELLAQDEVMQ